MSHSIRNDDLDVDIDIDIDVDMKADIDAAFVMMRTTICAKTAQLTRSISWTGSTGAEAGRTGGPALCERWEAAGTSAAAAKPFCCAAPSDADIT